MIITLFPAGAGQLTENTTHGAPLPNWQCAKDFDDSFVESISNDPVKLTDLYTIDANAIPVTATINSVTVFLQSMGKKISKVGSSALKVSPALRENGVNTVGTVQTTTANYALYSQVWSTRPSDSGAWTKSDIDSLEIGVSQSGITTGINEVRTNQVYVEVDYTE